MTDIERTARPWRSASPNAKKYRPDCSLCDDSGAVLYDQVEEDGRRVAVAYQCVCQKRGNHPNLIPASPQPSYIDDRRYGD